MTKKLKIVVNVSNDLVGCKTSKSFLIDAEEWEEMTGRDREEMCRDVMFEMIDWGYEAREIE